MMEPGELIRATTHTSQFSFESDQDTLGGHESLVLHDEADLSQLGVGRQGRVFGSLQELREEQDRLCAEAAECTGVAGEDAFLLLRSHCWDPAAFNEAFFDDPDGVRRRAGVSEAEEDVGARAAAAGSAKLCGICFCDPGEHFLPCSRRPLRTSPRRAEQEHPLYCRDCWRRYCEHAAQEGKACLDLRCPVPGCGEAVRPSVFSSLLAAGPALDRYLRFTAESLVDDSRGRTKWCPGQRCGRAAREPASGLEVSCPCGTLWCFGCNAPAHLPVTCETVRQWETKCRDSSADTTWIQVNTKFCPQCSNPIEKNGGCMHMTCRKPGGCGHEFCWICLGKWSGHSACNAAASEEDKLKELKKAAAKSELMRYAHHYERYLAHHKAEAFAASTQLQSMELTAGRFVTTLGFGVGDVQFLAEAVLQIRSCRRFLKWTYAHAFLSRFTQDERKLFEFHQAQLEGTLERLSDIMENTSWEVYLGSGMDSHRPFYDIRSQIISLSCVVRDFFSSLQQAIQQGTLFFEG